MAVAALLLTDLAWRLPDLATFYTDDGVMPRTLLLSLVHRTFFPLHLTAGTLWGVGLLHALSAAAAGCLLLGWRTRPATLACWLLHLSLRARNAWVLDAGDAELTLTLLWGLFLPWGARGSIDALRHPRWAGLPVGWRGFAGGAYALQIGVIYLFAALLKTDPLWLVSGDALYYVLQRDSLATGPGRWLRHYPEQLRPLTFAALGWELAIPCLLWAPFRGQALRGVGWLFLVLFHLAIACLLHVGLMVPVAIGCSLGLLPCSLCDRGRGLGPIWERFLRGVDRWLPGASSVAGVERGGVADVPDGTVRLACLSERSDRGEPAVDCVFNGSGHGSGAPPGYFAGRATRWLLGAGCAYVLVINLANRFEWDLPLPVQVFGYVTQLQQSWPLFAPSPGDEDGWYLVEGTDWRHRQVNLLNGEPASNYRPTDVAATYIDRQWRCFFLTMQVKREPAVEQRLLAWAAARWNAAHAGDDQVYFARLIFFNERTERPGKPITFYAETWAQRQVQGPGTPP